MCEVEAREEGNECEASGAANKEEGSENDFRADSRVVDNALPPRLRRGVLAPGKHANEGIKGQDGKIQGRGEEEVDFRGAGSFEAIGS